MNVNRYYCRLLTLSKKFRTEHSTFKFWDSAGEALRFVDLAR